MNEVATYHTTCLSVLYCNIIVLFMAELVVTVQLW